MSSQQAGVLGVGFGLALFFGAFPLLFWNEGRAVQTARALEEGAAAVVPTTVEPVAPENDAKLVYAQGVARTAETLADVQLGVRVAAIRLERQVELYQWQEKRETHDQQTKVSYARVWNAQLIDSGGYQSGHQNPDVLGAAGVAIPAERWQAQTVMLGALRLSGSLVQAMQPAPLRLEDAALAQLPPELRRTAKVFDGQFYFGTNPQAPEIGDLRVRYRQVPAQAEVSVVAKQEQARLVPYRARNGRLLEFLRMGMVPAETIFAEEQTANTIMTWALRAVGFFMLMFGVQLVLSPLTGLLGNIPFLGAVLNAGIGWVAAMLAGILALGTVAVAWFYFRPWLSVALALVIVALITGLYRRTAQARPV